MIERGRLALTLNIAEGRWNSFMELRKTDTIRVVYDHAMEVFLSEVGLDFIRQGYTNRRCPVCGNKMEWEGTYSAHTVRCKTSDCVEETVRGL